MQSDREGNPTANEVIKVVFNPQEHRARSVIPCFKKELTEVEVLGQEHKAPVSCVLEKDGMFGGTSTNTAPMNGIHCGLEFISTRVRVRTALQATR